MSKSMINLEFGKHEGPKWIREWFFEVETLDEVRKLLLEISNEFKSDASYLDLNIQVKAINNQNKVHHYITPLFPGVWIP